MNRSSRSFLECAWGLIALGVCACGPDLKSSFAPASHLPFPTVSPHSGRRLSAPQLVTVTFADASNPSLKTLSDFGDFLVGSQWLSTIGAEYGVGTGQHVAKVQLSDAAPVNVNDSSIQLLLESHINRHVLPTPNAQTLYLLYFPLATQIDASERNLDVLCGPSGYTGYHFWAQHNGVRYAYAVVANCTGAFSGITTTASHELIESATDPDLDAWYLDVPATDPWFARNRDELADLCEGTYPVEEGGYALSRLWSNGNAQAGLSPCAPLPPNSAFFNVTASPNTVPVIAGGQSATFILTGWSNAYVTGWPLFVKPGPYNAFDPKWSMSTMDINNGKSATLTLTVPPGSPSGAFGSVLVYSGPLNDAYWPVSVVSR